MNEFQFLQAIAPVHHWYQPDECDPRDNVEILQDIVNDLQEGRTACLNAQRIAQDAKRLCQEGHPVSAFNLADAILEAFGVGHVRSPTAHRIDGTQTQKAPTS